MIMLSYMGRFFRKGASEVEGTEGYLSPRQGSRKGPHIPTQLPLPLQASKGLPKNLPV